MASDFIASTAAVIGRYGNVSSTGTRAARRVRVRACVCVLSAGSGVDIVSQQSLAERLEVVHSYVHDDDNNDNDSESASDNSEDASSIASLGGSEENLPKVTYRPHTHTHTYVWDHVLSCTV